MSKRGETTSGVLLLSDDSTFQTAFLVHSAPSAQVFGSGTAAIVSQVTESVIALTVTVELSVYKCTSLRTNTFHISAHLLKHISYKCT